MMKLIRMLFRGIRDAFKSVFRNFSLSIASVSCISITLIVVAISLVASLNVNSFTESIKKDVTIVVFVKSKATDLEFTNLYEKMKDDAIRILKENNIVFDKYYWNIRNKVEICQKENIDIMIDDRAGQCKKMRANGVHCMLMFTKYNRKEKEDLPFATSWKNLYEEITKLCKKEM